MNAIYTAPPPLAFEHGPWDSADQALTLAEPAGEASSLPIATRRRRGFTPQMLGGRASVSLRDDEGVLRWAYEPPPAQALRSRARRAGLSDLFSLGAPLKRFDYADIGPNQVTAGLVALDRKLTPAFEQGLRRWDGAQLQPTPPPQVKNQRVLVLVHGTFSNSEMWFHELASTAAGQALLQQWQASYGPHIYAFDHATLSVAPWLNALDLHQALRGVAAPIDVVCHSRGGLVVSWLLRLAPVPVQRVVFVGSPLMGTSLASPYRLRAALDMLANVANALALAGSAASTVFPLAAGAAGLAKVLGKTLKLGASVPLADAAVALVPGLASQQRTDNNAETTRLFASAWLVKPKFAAVTADFEPNIDEPAWKFWTRFKHIGAQLADAGADTVFPGANDLVVDTASMSDLGQPAQGPIALLALGKTATTYHTNYFRDAAVVGFLAGKLQ
jgi:pimeloyl-ACP methyl ester carboxylesterase